MEQIKLTVLKKDPFLIFLPALTIAIRLVVFYFFPNTYEDSYITFKYAENLASGIGFCYNPGEIAMGTTTPFFALILAFFKYLGITCITSSLIINVLSEGITTVVVYLIIRHFLDNWLAAIPSLLFVLSPSNISWAISGMETVFFGATIALTFLFYIKENFRLALIFSVLCAIIRIDGLSVTAVILIASLWKRNQIRIIYFLIPIILFLAWELYLYIQFKAFIPSTIIAKLTLYSGHQSSRFNALKVIISTFFQKSYYISSLMSLLFIGGTIAIINKRSRAMVLPIWFFVYFGAFAIGNTFMHGWYFIPPMFSYIAVTGIGILYIALYFHDRIKLLKCEIVWSMIFLAVMGFGAVTLGLKIHILSEEAKHLEFRKSIGEYINSNYPPNATLYAEPIGIIGYFAKRYIIDETGLVSPQLIKFNRMEPTMENVAKKIEYSQPSIILQYNKNIEEFRIVKYINDNYLIVKRFDPPPGAENIGMTLMERRE
jgi:arabinofuranosyltransferase